MPINPGLYQIRFVPPHVTPPFSGGVFAVGDDINKPVEALPLVPPTPGVHTWEVSAAPNKKDQWVITRPGFKSPSIFQGVGPVRAGWGRPARKPVQIPEGTDPAAAAEVEVKADTEADAEGILPHPDLPVLFTTTFKNWVINEVSDGGGDPRKATYTITVPAEVSGVTAAVGVENHHLVTKNFPVLASVYPLPTWQFIPIID